MPRKAKTYRNRIELMLGLTVADVVELSQRSSLYKQRVRQKRRWSAHRARVEESA